MVHRGKRSKKGRQRQIDRTNNLLGRMTSERIEVLTIPHKRSFEARERRAQRKAAEDIINEHSFKDRGNGDIVNRLSGIQVGQYLAKRYPKGVIIPTPRIECGEVRYNPRGTGSAQIAVTGD